VIFYILDIFPGTVLYQDFLQRTGYSDDFWLKRVEDIMFFETDEQLSEDMILAFGRKLRSEYYRNLPGFADEIELIDRQELYESHADFLSRLAMTFSHGDYSAIEAIPQKDELSERLYERALSCFPDHRAYLGLGILRQKQRKYKESIAILSEGTKNFPESEQLAVCLGISYMNLSEYEKALQCLQKFSHSEDVIKYIRSCYKALGYPQKAPPR
jgi:anaerobic magnesium-protoporphyrin IX monomethyl ester cyclase